MALAALPESANAQSETQSLPANAHAKSYSDGWECDRGYRQEEDSCIEIEIPANAYATGRSYGSGWECAHGYRRADDACTAILVPLDAFLNSNGDGWTCNRLFRRVDEVCEAIIAPANGYLIEGYGGSIGDTRLKRTAV